MPTSQLDTFQLEIFHRLKSDPVLRLLNTIRQDTGDIEADVLKSLGPLGEGADGKSGVCLIVMRSRAEVNNANTPGPLFEVVGLVRVLEMPLVNRAAAGTGITASTIAERVLHVVSHYLPKGVSGVALPDRKAIEPYDEDIDSGIIGWDVQVRTRGGMESGDKVSTPSITGTIAAVTLTSNVVGAALYYTTDGSAPCSGNEAAIAYTVPFAVDAGTTVRAGAEVDDMVPSDSASKTF